MTRILIHPGLFGSGPGHWQSLWEKRHPEYVRVEQADWNNPDRQAWVQTLEHYVAEDGADTVIVAHSLGCHTVSHWAKQSDLTIKGAMLVAPPDVTAESCPPQVRGFVPVAMQPLHFPSIVVASENDPHGSVDYARQCARAWGSEFVLAGALGHINEESDIGEWQAGYACLERLT